MRDNLVKIFSFLVPKFLTTFFADVYCSQVGETRLSLIIANKAVYSTKLRSSPKVAKTIEIDDKQIVVFTDGSRKEYKITENGPVFVSDDFRQAKKEKIELGKEPTLVG